MGKDTFPREGAKFPLQYDPNTLKRRRDRLHGIEATAELHI